MSLDEDRALLRQAIDEQPLPFGFAPAAAARLLLDLDARVAALEERFGTQWKPNKQ